MARCKYPCWTLPCRINTHTWAGTRADSITAATATVFFGAVLFSRAVSCHYGASGPVSVPNQSGPRLLDRGVWKLNLR